MFLMKPVNCVIWIRVLRSKEAALLLKPPISSGWLKRSWQVLAKGAILFWQESPRLLNSSSSGLVHLHRLLCCLVYLWLPAQGRPLSCVSSPQGLSLTQHSAMFSLPIPERPQHVQEKQQGSNSWSKIQIIFPPLRFTLMFAYCIWVTGQSFFLMCDVLIDSDIGRNLKTTQQKPLLVPWGQWMKGSVLYCSEKLCGVQRGRSQEQVLYLWHCFRF